MKHTMNALSVFRDANSHCCLRINEWEGAVEFIAIVDDGGALSVDQFTVTDDDFYNRFGHELPEYPVKRAANHYLHPLTPAISVSLEARKTLNAILTDKDRTMNDTTKPLPKNARKAVVKDESSKATANIAATEKASVRTNNKAHDKTEPAPVVVAAKSDKVLKQATTKAVKGTFDAKVTNAEYNRAKVKDAVKSHEAEKKKAAKEAAQRQRKEAKEKLKAAKKAERDAKKTANSGESNSEDTKMATNTDTAKKTAAKKAPAKKAAPSKKAPAKKAAKKPEPAAKKIVKKSAAAKKAAPAKKSGGKKSSAGRPGKYTEDQKIKVLVDDNPKREGSASYKVFELLKKSKTVAEFYKKGGKPNNLRNNEKKGFIKIT